MRALPDTSFIRHLEATGSLRLVASCAERLGWEFVMARAVHDELAVKGMPPAIEGFIGDGMMAVESCERDRLKSIEGAFPTLGRGEAESICIVDGCKDRTFRGYLILTDDIPAQRKAGGLGMNSLDSSQFILLLNEKQVISKPAAKGALERLSRSVYGVGDATMGDCMRRLR